MNFQSCIGSQRQLINRLVMIDTNEAMRNMREHQYSAHLDQQIKDNPQYFGHIVSLGISAMGDLGVNVLLATGETCFYHFDQVYLI